MTSAEQVITLGTDVFVALAGAAVVAILAAVVGVTLAWRRAGTAKAHAPTEAPTTVPVTAETPISVPTTTAVVPNAVDVPTPDETVEAAAAPDIMQNETPIVSPAAVPADHAQTTEVTAAATPANAPSEEEITMPTSTRPEPMRQQALAAVVGAVPDQVRDEAAAALERAVDILAERPSEVLEAVLERRGQFTVTISDFFALMRESYNDVARLRSTADAILAEMERVRDQVVQQIVDNARSVPGMPELDLVRIQEHAAKTVPGTPAARLANEIKRLHQAGRPTEVIATELGTSLDQVELTLTKA